MSEVGYDNTVETDDGVDEGSIRQFMEPSLQPGGSQLGPPSVLDSEEEEEAASPHHPAYYFKNGIVVLLVGNRYFKVPRIRLEQTSPVMKQLFEDAGLPSSIGGTSGYCYGLPGESDDRPVVLQDVTSEDFARLLSFLYPLTIDYESFTDSWTHKHWMSILRLANKFEMVDIQTKAITKLTHLNDFKTPIEKIKCGEQYSHTAWIQEGYKELIKRRESLSVAESKQIGLENTAFCAAAREKYHDLVPRPGSVYYTTIHKNCWKNHTVEVTLPEPTLGSWKLDQILYDHFPHLNGQRSRSESPEHRFDFKPSFSFT